MVWTYLKTTRSAGLLLACLATVLCSPASGFVQLPTSLSSFPSYPEASIQCNRLRLVASRTCTSPLVPSAFGGTQQEQWAYKPPAVAVVFRGGSVGRLWMSSPAPPVKPPKKRGYGGGGRGDDLYVRELLEPEKSEVLGTWKSYALADGGEKFAESIQILNEMGKWRSGVIAARKRQFTLACCKGETIQAVACVQIGPKNDAARSFFAQEACMSLVLLNVDPASPQFKAGAHLCKEIKEIGRLENMAVSFQPIKDIYSGRFYAATLTM